MSMMRCKCLALEKKNYRLLKIMWKKTVLLFRILPIPPIVNHKGKEGNSDWLADQWDKSNVLWHAASHKGRMKSNYPEIYSAQTPKRFDRLLALLEKI